MSGGSGSGAGAGDDRAARSAGVSTSGRGAEDVRHPRWARVNLIKASSVQAVLDLLAAPPASWPEGARGGRVGVPSVDPLLPDLLRFPPGTDLHDHPLVEEGTLILQASDICHNATYAAGIGTHIMN